jgi:starch synthase
MVSSEMSPWAKSGGLADVVSALPAALAGLGYTVGVVIPRFLSAVDAPARRVVSALRIPLPSGDQEIDIRELSVRDGGAGPGRVIVYLIDAPELYGRAGLYGGPAGDYPDNQIRFAVFARAALEVSRRLFATDVFHCHDWQSALLPVYLKTRPAIDPRFISAKTLLTIHNLGYQGLFEAAAFDDLGLPPGVSQPGGLEFWGRVNFLKGGIVYADAISTVSPTYAREIQTSEFGFGLDGVLRSWGASVTGILNGVDYSRWNPETDPFIPARYSVSDLSGKRECKRQLLAEMGLPGSAMDKPLLGIVSRFATQKGFDLLGDAARELFREDVYLVALGSGEPVWEQLFRDLTREFPGRVGLRFGYDDPLAHRIEAGSDIFLMPSRYEPCGLNQIYSLRYGTIPVVRATGGLDDTIVDATLPDATGFKFADYNGKALLEAIRRACLAMQDRKGWAALMTRAMRKEFSWAVAARQYSDLYGGLVSGSAFASRTHLGDSN